MKADDECLYCGDKDSIEHSFMGVSKTRDRGRGPGTSPQTIRVTFTYIHHLYLNTVIQSRQSNIEASCTNLISSSAQISAIEVSLSKIKGPLFKPIKCLVQMVFT